MNRRHFLAALLAAAAILLQLPQVAQAATLTVDSTADGGDTDTSDGLCNDGTGACTLRAAIEQANASPGHDTINFAIGSGPQTIAPAAPLPVITDQVTIDGTTQPGFSGSPIIVLDGGSAGGAASGLVLTANNSTVEGLVIDRFSQYGIEVQGSLGGNTIAGNYIGADITGTAAAGNGVAGVHIVDSPGNAIGGTATEERNIISGNNADGAAGVLIEGINSTSNTVAGNFVGTDWTGSQELANGFFGVGILGSSGNTIGGESAGARNVISGNFFNVYAIGADDTLVEGNLIGTDASGSAALGVNLAGVTIVGGSNSTIGGLSVGARNVISGDGNSVWLTGGAIGTTIQGNYIGTDVTGTTAVLGGVGGIFSDDSSNNLIGGTAPGARNVISGIDGNAIEIQSSTGNIVQGNYIGVDAGGTSDLGNSFAGVQFFLGGNNIVGGTVSGAGNLISGNRGNGVVLFGSSDNVVQGNYIGTDATGTAAVGNTLDGVIVDATSNSPSSNNTIGGSGAGAGNLISGNGANGIEICNVLPFCGNGGTSGNLVEGNKIGTDAGGTTAIGNLAHGVRLAGASDTTVGGTAPEAQNTIAYNGGDGVLVEGSTTIRNTIRGNSIHSNTGKGIENIDGGNTELPPPTVAAAGSASGTACASCVVDVYSDSGDEGRIYDGSAVADGAGNWSFAGAVAGPNVTATATDTSGNTSEFSAPFVVPADLAVTKLCKPDTNPLATQPINCTVFVDNYGPSDARGVVVDDVMLSSGTFTVSNVSPALGSGTPGCTLSAVTGGQKLSCRLGTVAAASTTNPGPATITYTISVTEGQDINNVATVRSDTPDPNTANNQATVNLSIASVADLSLVKTAAGTVVAGTNLTYNLTVTNNGPSTADNVVVTDNLPSQEIVLSVSGSGGATCNAGVPGDPFQPTTCSFGTLGPAPASATMTVVVQVKPDTLGTIHNDARVTSDTFDDNTNNNLASVSTDVTAQADLSITKAATPNPVVAGMPLSYQVTVANGGPSTAVNVSLTDPLSSALTLTSTSVSVLGGSCGLQTNTNTVQCQLGNLDPGQGAVVFIYTNVSPSASDGSVITNTATVSSPTPDPGPSANAATVTSNVIARADLGITLTSDALVYDPPATIHYQITVTNAGPSDAQNVVLTMVLPGLRVGFYISNDAGCPPPSGTTFTCSLGTIAAGGTKTFQLNFFVHGNQGTITSTASVTSSTSDPNLTNNSSARTVTVGKP